MNLAAKPTGGGATPLGRVERRKQRTRGALIDAGRSVMAEKGIDGATMNEIAERADVGAGTVYSYFESKDDLAVAVLESLMLDLARKIETVTDTFDDPAQVYAYGCRACLETAVNDIRWRHLLDRSEVMADAMFKQMGPFATRDLARATHAGRFHVDDPQATFRLASYAIIGAARSIVRREIPADAQEQVVVMLLRMTGVDRQSAVEIAGRPRPRLP